jgi:hypothetical protein
MKIIKEKFKTDRDGLLYWGRVYFIADNREAKTKVLWAMSFEWVRRRLLAEAWKEDDVEHLLNKEVVNKIKQTKRKVFNSSVKLWPCGLDAEDEAALVLYLQEREKADRHG